MQGGLRGGIGPPLRGFRGSSPQRKKILPRKHVTYLGGFSAHGFFVDGFLFSVKELGLLTNPSHWVRVLDVRWLLYVYCIVNNVTL
jgi:hypothetical protein